MTESVVTMDPTAFENLLKSKYPEMSEEHLASAQSLNARFSGVDDLLALRTGPCLITEIH